MQRRIPAALVNSDRYFFENLGIICISVHRSNFLGTRPPLSPVIWERDRIGLLYAVTSMSRCPRPEVLPD